MEKSVVVRFKFDTDSASNPMICYLARDYHLVFSLLQADVRPGFGGICILKLTGEEEDIRKGLEFAENCGVKARLLSKSIILDSDSCVDCGACTAVCIHKALTLDPVTWEVVFDNEKCVVCEMCTHACPTNSLRADFA